MDKIERFMQSKSFAVAGASANRAKFGNKVLRCLKQNGYDVTPINPLCDEIEGLSCAKSVQELPNCIKSLSIITPPQITETVVLQAISKGITNIWMQPGAESVAAIQLCKANNVNVIADGSCLLIILHYHDHS